MNKKTKKFIKEIMTKQMKAEYKTICDLLDNKKERNCTKDERNKKPYKLFQNLEIQNKKQK